MDWQGTGPIAWAAAAVFLAGLLRGYTGFGFAIAGVPLLSLVIPPAEAVPLVLALTVSVGVVELFRGTMRREAHWSSLLPMAAGAILTTPLGVLLLSALPAAWGRVGIALTVLGAALLMLRGGSLTRAPGPLASAAVGTVSGLCNGFAAMPGPPVIALYLASPIPAATARATMMMFFTFTAVAGLVTGLAALPGAVRALWLVPVTLPLMLAGTTLGARGFARGTAGAYRRIALACFAALSLLTALRAAWSLLA
ncbi:sulfite exporter TauE/SafE family protein [Muricoccus radiodurans]|uniref:sulfite exporter TauE/SafE family protein n=1 Tax=Muricoccus radiodurans TaxID=2231721 RepID=UPI003CF9883F